MYLFVLKIFLYSVIMRIVLLLVFLIFSFPITAYSWEKVLVPDYVNKKTFFKKFKRFMTSTGRVTWLYFLNNVDTAK